MIKSFRHKGLKLFFETGSNKDINAEHGPKLARILDRLDASKSPADMDLPGYRLHKLTGQERDYWAVWISSNWRITFKFVAEDAMDVDYLDYH